MKMRNNNLCKNCVLNHGHVLVVEDGHSSNCHHVDDILMADAHVGGVADQMKWDDVPTLSSAADNA
jgi:hypothetical protein